MAGQIYNGKNFFRNKISGNFIFFSSGSWQLAVGSWQLAGGNWQGAVDRWQLVGGRWHVAQLSGGCEKGWCPHQLVLGGKFVTEQEQHQQEQQEEYSQLSMY